MKPRIRVGSMRHLRYVKVNSSESYWCNNLKVFFPAVPKRKPDNHDALISTFKAP